MLPSLVQSSIGAWFPVVWQKLDSASRHSIRLTCQDLRVASYGEITDASLSLSRYEFQGRTVDSIADQFRGFFSRFSVLQRVTVTNVLEISTRENTICALFGELPRRSSLTVIFPEVNCSYNALTTPDVFISYLAKALFSGTDSNDLWRLELGLVLDTVTTPKLLFVALHQILQHPALEGLRLRIREHPAADCPLLSKWMLRILYSTPSLKELELSNTDQTCEWALHVNSSKLEKLAIRMIPVGPLAPAFSNFTHRISIGSFPRLSTLSIVNENSLEADENSLEPQTTPLFDVGSLPWGVLTGLQTLELDGIPVLPSSLADLSPLVGLRRLSLRRTQLTAETVHNIIPILEVATSLRELDLSINFLTVMGAAVLVNTLPRLRSLRRLFLSLSWFGMEGIEALVPVMLQLPQLETLDLMGNCIEAANVSSLGSLLSLHPSLRSLDLKYNNLGYGGVAALISLAKQSVSEQFEELLLADNLHMNDRLKLSELQAMVEGVKCQVKLV